MAEFRNNPQWITEAHNLGMTVNAWTADDYADISEMTLLGVDFITTNKPEDATKIKDYYDNNQ